MDPEKKLDTLLLKANLSERSEQYEEMVRVVKELIVHCNENNLEFTAKIRNFFSIAYKNLTGSRRTSWRTLNLEKEKYKDAEIDDYNIIIGYLKNVEDELNVICDDVVDHIDSYIMTENNKLDLESKVFFLKMKGDYFRYKAEVLSGQAFQKCRDESKASYEEAAEMAKSLPPVNSLRLGLSLNFSVFYYEIDKSPSKACILAKQAFDDAIKDIDALSEEHYKDSTLIMQLLRDNLSLWTHRDETKADKEE